MALNISFFDPKIEDCEDNYVGAPSHTDDLFGFYSWRGVWGSAEVLKKGGKFLYTLRESDLYVYPQDLPSFKSELEKILNDSNEISEILKVEQNDMEIRLKNAILACDEAIENKFGVCIS